MNRRTVVHGLGAAALLPLVPQRNRRLAPPHIGDGTLPRAPLRIPPRVGVETLTLTARERRVEIAPGVQAVVWSPGDGPIGPLIDTSRGAEAQITLHNALPEPTILHWHGLRVPEAADGHPRFAIPPGARYDYRFPIADRAGTYWYHAHTHHHTGLQAYRGMAGMLLVRDPEEAALALPSGPYELPLLIQDRRLAADGTFEYTPVMHERMEGFFGDTPFVNGIRLPMQDVVATRYRLRLVNASTSRILRLRLSNGRPMQLIGSDGGLLDAAVDLPWVELATGERADLLVDFSGEPLGSVVSLQSAPFDAPGSMRGMRGMSGMGGMGRGMSGGLAQGRAMELLTFHVTQRALIHAQSPLGLPAIARLRPSEASRTREFTFASARMEHTINGRPFDLSRIDTTVRAGDTEIWTFRNDSPFPHPVHLHAVHFQLLERVGGRAQRFPWERGWKDTVLVYPGERVSVIMTFPALPGLYLMHCHNMMHEDLGMMMNFAIT